MSNCLPWTLCSHLIGSYNEREKESNASQQKYNNYNYIWWTVTQDGFIRTVILKRITFPVSFSILDLQFSSMKTIPIKMVKSILGIAHIFILVQQLRPSLHINLYSLTNHTVPCIDNETHHKYKGTGLLQVSFIATSTSNSHDLFLLQ